MTNFSPATKAVYEAAIEQATFVDDAELAVIYALRAAVNQVISPVSPPCQDFNEYDQGFLAAHIKYRAEFLAIVAELVATDLSNL
jgi:hypothetical protein